MNKKQFALLGLFGVVVSMIVFSLSHRQNPDCRMSIDSVCLDGASNSIAFTPVNEEDVSPASTTEKSINKNRVYRPKTEGKRNPHLKSYEIEHNLSPETSAGRERRQFAQRFGTRGKITLLVVDANGIPVQGARVFSWFYMARENDNPKVVAFTDDSGCVELEHPTMSHVEFYIDKAGYYRTQWEYGFLQRGYNCVENGRWIPWNPTLEVVLKEIRDPIDLVQIKTKFTFPASIQVGYDFAVGDMVEPHGRGKVADAVFSSTGTVKHGNEFHYTNMCVFPKGDGIISAPQDAFSVLKSFYSAPEDGYSDSMTFLYDYDGTHEGSRDTAQRERVLYFKIRGADSGEVRYGKILGGVVGGLAYPDTNTASFSFSYLLNPNSGDRNLEYELSYEFADAIRHLNTADEQKQPVPK